MKKVDIDTFARTQGMTPPTPPLPITKKTDYLLTKDVFRMTSPITIVLQTFILTNKKYENKNEKIT